ncbi:hypothetical protein UVI_02063760 [Ustilaginoidea virens]|uniref:Peroxin-3 family protein n=1 Tax=Ustilaginoidea virens TaxID=1159556 RepID=A0A1B5L9W1_USTVR|nr:hypothetical protein UVI_02063760 [Ustilaginoidea virens]
MAALDTEAITYEIQKIKASAKTLKPGLSESTTGPPSIADTTMTEEDGKSMATSASLHSESGIHASQIAIPAPSSSASPAQHAQQQHAQQQQQQDGAVLPPTVSPATRAFTLIYTLALLTMLTLVQLNLLGRRSYLSSVVALATGSQQATISLENNDDDNPEQDYGSDFDTNRKYLAFSWWLLNKGWVQIMSRVDSAVRSVLGSLSPRDLLSFDRFSELTMEVRKLVEGSTADERRRTDWLSVLLPPRHEEEEVIRQSGILEDNSVQGACPAEPSPATLRRLLDETADLIESPSFSHVLTLILDAAFEVLVDQKLAVEAFELPSQSPYPPPESMPLRESRVILLPKVLSVLTRQAHVIGSGVPNDYLQRMETVRALEAFAAVVYSSNWENEIRQEAIMDSAANMSKDKTQPQLTRPHEQQKQPAADESIVVVDSAAGEFETAWEKARGKTS